jgi:hypothetical protein
MSSDSVGFKVKPAVTSPERQAGAAAAAEPPIFSSRDGGTAGADGFRGGAGALEEALADAARLA